MRQIFCVLFLNGKPVRYVPAFETVEILRDLVVRQAAWLTEVTEQVGFLISDLRGQVATVYPSTTQSAG